MVGRRSMEIEDALAYCWIDRSDHIALVKVGNA